MHTERLQVLNQILADLATVTDAMGKPIEPGIIETCAVLNALGFLTEQSCEGHLDWGQGVPWVTMSTPLAEKIDWSKKDHKELREQLHTELNQLKLALIEYLKKFYAQKQIPYDDAMLIVETGGSMVTLLPAIGDAFLSLPMAERRKRLPAYQEEMKEFTTFLKNIYLDGANLFILPKD